MLLETLDIKKNDVVIFSQNIFDLEKNFKIIYKDDPSNEIKPISYNEVCKFISEFTPKNLIIYRLLTNIKDFEIYLPKYGYILKINMNPELVYFDPVFAIRELQEYNETLNYYNIRFRIQQVGLTTLNRSETSANYAEIYSIDLESSEALNQNDKVFVDALFVNDNIQSITKLKESIQRKPSAAKLISSTEKSFAKKIPKLNSKPAIKENKIIPSLKTKKKNDSSIEDSFKDNIIITEDLDFDYKKMRKITLSLSEPLLDKNDDFSELSNKRSKHKVKNTTSQFSKFLENYRDRKSHSTKIDETKENGIINIFKSSISLKTIKDKENQHYVLKLDNKKSQ